MQKKKKKMRECKHTKLTMINNDQCPHICQLLNCNWEQRNSYLNDSQNYYRGGSIKKNHTQLPGPDCMILAPLTPVPPHKWLYVGVSFIGDKSQ